MADLAGNLRGKTPGTGGEEVGAEACEKPAEGEGLGLDEAGDQGEAAGSDLFGEANELARKRGRGRPPGALNIHTQEFEKWYYAQGFMDPLARMAFWVTADPIGLWLWIRGEHLAAGKRGKTDLPPTLFDIIREQHAVARELAPYLHGKKPVELVLTDERLPTLALVLGTDQLTLTRQLAEAGALRLGAPIEVNEINGLDE